MPFGGLLTVGIIGAASSLGGAAMASSAAGSAADEQAQSAQNVLDFQKQIWNQQQTNLAPWISAGNTSIAGLMNALDNGTFGAGSVPNAPTFAAPTLEDARSSPGYQFTAQQGSKGILQGAGAAGGAISGGTLRALDTFNTGLADSTYNDVFSRALSTYNASLNSYQTNLAKQAQEYQEMFAPAQLGENAVAGLNNTGSAVASNVGNLMTQVGNAQAAGTIGGANAWSSGISGAANNVTQALLIKNLLGAGSPTAAAPAPGPTYQDTGPYGAGWYAPGVGPG